MISCYILYFNLQSLTEHLFQFCMFCWQNIFLTIDNLLNVCVNRNNENISRININQPCCTVHCTYQALDSFRVFWLSLLANAAYIAVWHRTCPRHRLAPPKYIWLTWGRARVWVGTGCAVYCSSGHGWTFIQETTLCLHPQRDSTIPTSSWFFLINSCFPQIAWKKAPPTLQSKLSKYVPLRVL